MAIRRIFLENEPVLRKKSRPVEQFDSRLAALLDDLSETLAEADGVGLAAPQVGILRRAVVIDVGEGVIEMVNPEITTRSEDELNEPEGCLSSPGEYGMVCRPRQVGAVYFDRNGKRHTITGEGLLARAICHETDHLDGRLFKDLATEMLDPKELSE